MTEQETKLWYGFLKALPFHFSRQKVVGKYIVDFYCASKKIIIEIDGSQHYGDESLKADECRDEFLTAKGFKVLRYTNLDINLRFEDTCEDILHYLNGEK